MQNKPYHKELRATAICTTQATERIKQYKSAVTILIGNSQFDQVRAVVAREQCNIEYLYQIKTNY